MESLSVLVPENNPSFEITVESPGSREYYGKSTCVEEFVASKLDPNSSR